MAHYPFFWFNGDILSSQNVLPPTISPYDRGLLLGDGIFETIRVTNHTSSSSLASGWHAAHLARHYARLVQGCQILRLPVPDYNTIIAAIKALISANLAGGSSQPQALSLRLTYTHGPGPHGLNPPPSPSPTLLLTLSAAPHSDSPATKLFISPTYRRDAASPLCKVKSLSFLPFLLARYEAQDQGADDALLCNYAGHLVEASAASFLAVINGQLVTPPLSDGALPGISRARLIEAGLCKEASLIAEDLATGQQKPEAAWLVSALRLMPVCAINKREIDCNPTRHNQLLQFLFPL